MVPVLIESESTSIENKIMTEKNEKGFSHKFFIVHGHNNEKKLEIARFIETKLQKQAIILHEMASEGKTIIEKFEKHSEVDFAVALWTADDLGKTKTEEDLKYRARENVVYETGYFAGKLGRGRVIVLRENNVAIPSDLLGVIYIELSGEWKEELRKEIDFIYHVEDNNH